MQQAMWVDGLLLDNGNVEKELEDGEVLSCLRTRKPTLRNEISRGSSFKEFMDSKPPTSREGEDSLVCICWLQKMNLTFWFEDFSKKQKVKYATPSFGDETLNWWQAVYERIPRLFGDLWTFSQRKSENVFPVKEMFSELRESSYHWRRVLWRLQSTTPHLLISYSSIWTIVQHKKR